MMRFIIRSVVPVLVAVGALTLVGGQSARAQTNQLAAGSFATLPSSAANFYGGNQVGLTLFNSFDFTNAAGTARVAGNLYSTVYQGATGNTNGTDIYYQLQLNGLTTGGLSNFQIGDFVREALSVGQTPDDIDGGTAQFASGTLASSAAFRSQSATQDQVIFNYNNPPTGAVNTQTIVVRSSARSFATNGTAIVNTDVAANLSGNIYVTSLDTPEPATFALLGTGLASGGAGIVARRRRRSAKK